MAGVAPDEPARLRLSEVLDGVSGAVAPAVQEVEGCMEQREAVEEAAVEEAAVEEAVEEEAAVEEAAAVEEVTGPM